MDSFRSIYIVGTLQDSYNIYYFKEFFKLIGWFYRTDIEELTDVQLTEKALEEFDIVLRFERKRKKQGSYPLLAQSDEYQHMWVICQADEDIQEQTGEIKEAEAILREFIGNKAIFSVLEGDTVLSDLLSIYIENELVVPLYDYTDVLLGKYESKRGDSEFTVTDSICDDMGARWKSALSRLEIMEKSFIDGDYNNINFFACFPYAKCYVKKKINDNCLMKKQIISYSTEDLLKEIDQIYQYDSNFFKAEFLKACVAESDIMYFSFAERYHCSCIEKCPKEFFKSIFLYAYGKCLDSNGKISQAGEAYIASYGIDPGNIKAIFKRATDAIRRDQFEEARECLKRLTILWPDDLAGRSYVPMKEIEYAYKAYKLLERLDGSSKEYYASKAKEILDFIQGNAVIKEGENEEEDTQFFPAMEYHGEPQEESSFSMKLYRKHYHLFYQIMCFRLECVNCLKW